MKVTKITFEQLYPTGQYANQRLGAEITFDDDDFLTTDKKRQRLASDVTTEAFHNAKTMVELAFKSMNPDLSTPSLTDYNTGQPAAPPVIDRAKETLKEIINDCTTKEELIKHKDDVGKYGLADYYADKLEKLK